MDAFRRLIALLLMATVPAYAWAVTGVWSLCAMSSASEMEAVQAEPPDRAHACCDLAATEDSPLPAKGNACPSGQPCKTGGLHHAQLSGVPASLVAPDRLAASVEAPVLSRDPAGIWRPPRSA